MLLKKFLSHFIMVAEEKPISLNLIHGCMYNKLYNKICLADIFTEMKGGLK